MARRGHNEGSIYKRADDGRWAATITLGYENGKRKRKTFYGQTRKEVQEQLTVALRAQQQGLPIGSDRQTVGQYLDWWLTEAHKSNIRLKTFTFYRYIIHGHLIPSLGRITLTKLTAQEVQEFLKLKLDSGLSPRTVHHCRTVLRTALEDAVRWDLVPRNVAGLVKSPHIKRTEIVPLDPEQALRLLDVVRTHRLAALYDVALAVGLREGEALGLRWQDVDFNAGTISVRVALQRVDGKLRMEEVKSATSHRMIMLPDVAVESLCAHRLRQETERQALEWAPTSVDLVFTSNRGTPLEPRNVVRHFHGMLRKAGLPHKRFYDLRHTCASLLLVQGVHPRVVMEILGHSQISLTMNTYSHVIPTLQADAAVKMNALLRNKAHQNNADPS